MLQIVTATIAPGDTSVTFLVPGHEVWTPRSVFAIADRAAGGTPNRAYTLVITNGQTVLAQVGAIDAGAEPGTCDVTWANTPAANVGSGALGISVAPLGPFRLPAGYELTANIENAVAGDQWVSAVCWTDFEYSA